LAALSLHAALPIWTLQAVTREDILNVGGFSDTVFEVIAAFAGGKLGPRYWVGDIEQIEL
jgi:60 kDa SS-A/Ro ribonucleoprotein